MPSLGLRQSGSAFGARSIGPAEAGPYRSCLSREGWLWEGFGDGTARVWAGSVEVTGRLGRGSSRGVLTIWVVV